MTEDVLLPAEPNRFAFSVDRSAKPGMLTVRMMNQARDQANDRMIREQVLARGVRDPRVISALRSVPRDLFVPRAEAAAAWQDSPLPLELGQTISQPYIVALMTELLELHPTDSVLEIGTGSGYQTAILGRLASRVCSAELEPALARSVAARLEALGVSNVELRVGDGVSIFADRAPFEAILSAAAPLEIPDELLAQLAEGGRCILPVGGQELQYLYRIRRTGGRLLKEQLDPVRFVPLRRGL